MTQQIKPHEVNKNQLWVYSSEYLAENKIAVANCPRLVDGDVVVIEGRSMGKRSQFWEKLGIPTYQVKIINFLSKHKRKPLDNKVVGSVPHVTLNPWKP